MLGTKNAVLCHEAIKLLRVIAEGSFISAPARSNSVLTSSEKEEKS